MTRKQIKHCDGCWKHTICEKCEKCGMWFCRDCKMTHNHENEPATYIV